MMRKFLFTGLSVLLMLVIGSSLALAQTTGPATVYQVTITKFEMYNGSEWLTVFEGTSEAINIAGTEAGTTAGTFMSGLDVPDGSYTQLRVWISDTFVIRGNVGTSYTTAATSGSPAGCVSGTAAQVTSCTVDVPGGMNSPEPDILPTTLTVINGIPSHKIRVDFGVNNAIQIQSGLLFPANPDVTMTMIAL